MNNFHKLMLKESRIPIKLKIKCKKTLNDDVIRNKTLERIYR